MNKKKETDLDKRKKSIAPQIIPNGNEDELKGKQKIEKVAAVQNIQKRENLLKRNEYLAVWVALALEIILLIIAHNILVVIPKTEKEGIFYSENFIKILEDKCKDLKIGAVEEIPITLIKEETYTLGDLRIEKAEIKKDTKNVCTINFIKNIKRDITETITLNPSVQVCVTRNATGEKTCY